MLINLKTARLEHRMSQREVGAWIDKDQTQFSKIESGKVNMTAREASVLCRKFRLTIEQLVFEPAEGRENANSL